MNDYGLPPFINTLLSDVGATATITGKTDRIFLSGQIQETILYTCVNTTTLNVDVSLSRNKVINAGDVNNPNIVADLWLPVYQQTFSFNLTSGVTDTLSLNAIFTSFIDVFKDVMEAGSLHELGTYEYRFDTSFYTDSFNPSDVVIYNVYYGTRTLTSQVVKQ